MTAMLKVVANNVIPLHKRRRGDIVASLTKLLDQARTGELDGFLWVARYGPDDHAPGAAGEYVNDLETGARAAMALLDAIHLLDRK